MGKPIKVENSIYNLTSVNQAMTNSDHDKDLTFHNQSVIIEIIQIMMNIYKEQTPIN